MNPLRSILRRSVRQIAAWRMISPRRTAIWLHAAELGRWPDLENPKDINEKLIWLQFNTDTSLWSHLADKFEVREFVAGRGLSDILPEVYGIWDNASDIDFATLPPTFAIKSTNGNAQTILVGDKDSLDIDRLRGRIAGWGDKKFGVAGAEPHYARIPHRIMAEELLCSPADAREGRLPFDYKFWCFDGVPRYCMLCTGRDPRTFHSRFTLYSLPEWKRIPGAVVERYATDMEVPRPAELDSMIEIAERLSKGFGFIRVDLYDIQGKLYFGELTFTPFAARIKIFTREWLRRLGSLLPL